MHNSNLKSCNLELVRILSPKYTSFFVLRFVYIHHSQPFLKLAAPDQSVIVQVLCVPISVVSCYFSTLPSTGCHRASNIQALSCAQLGMSPIFSNHSGQYRFATNYSNGCTKGDERNGTIVSLSSLRSFAVLYFVERL